MLITIICWRAEITEKTIMPQNFGDTMKIYNVNLLNMNKKSMQIRYVMC